MPAANPPRRRSLLVLMAVAAVLVIVPFLGWHATWFGRPLTGEEIGRYLRDEQRPRRIQHALSQISARMDRGDPEAGQWYPQVLALAHHPLPAIRNTAAWVMGQDNRSEAFHSALAELLRDPEVMVRRNAALALVRFGDASGRGELLDMLQPHTVRSPAAGVVALHAQTGDEVTTGALLATVGETGVRAPLPGEVQETVAREGAPVTAGAPLVSIAPEAGQVWEALRALYFAGRPEDLPLVERYSRGTGGMSDRIRRQAALTARAIRVRSERAASR